MQGRGFPRTLHLRASYALFFVIQRFSIRADLHFRSFSMNHDLCFVAHQFVVFG